MMKVPTSNQMKTESDWLDAIASASNSSRAIVEETLLRHGVQAQSTPPRAKKVAFQAVKFSGIKVGTEADGPFEFEWNNLEAGLWAVMSDLNSRGKSSVMNLLHAAMRGDFPGKIKADIWKWLSEIRVCFCIDSTDYELLISKDAGIEPVDQASARLSRRDGLVWTALYSGNAGDGLKVQTESLFMQELGFTKIYASTSHGTPYAHSWPAVSSALFIGGQSEGKALFGDIMTDGLPLRLLQLFIGLPWVSTLTASSTASKLLEIEQDRAQRGIDQLAVFRNRLKAVRSELNIEKLKSISSNARMELRKRLQALDLELVAARSNQDSARLQAEEVSLNESSIRDSRTKLLRTIQQLKDEHDAGYVFRKLRPVCCPACESGFGEELNATEEAICLLCKSKASDDSTVDDSRLAMAQQDLELTTSSCVRYLAELKSADLLVQKATQAKQNIEQEINSIQTRIAAQGGDSDLRLASLEATAKELADLLGDQQDEPSKPNNPDKVILDAAVNQTKRMFEVLQKEVLEDVSEAIKTLSIKFGVQNVSEMSLNGAGHLKIVQGSADINFSKLSEGERLRVKIAAALAAVEVARERGMGRHPGLLLLDSPGAEEISNQDFHEMLLSVATAAKEMGGVQIIMGTVYRTELDDVVSRDRRKYAKAGEFLF